MAKIAFRTNPQVTEIFNHLEQYEEFCKDYGYRYNEADLYNFKSYKKGFTCSYEDIIVSS